MDLGERVGSEEHTPDVFVPEEFPQSVPAPDRTPVEAPA